MDTDRLERMADVTRRYGKYRPCGAGLGVVWGAFVLGALGMLMLWWTGSEYFARALPSQSLWRFLRSTRLSPPAWLQVAAVVAPFLAWAGLVAIQGWVDRRFGEVTTEATSCVRGRAPRWMAPFMVGLLACLLSGVLLWDAQASAAHGVVAMLGVAAWALVWGRKSRDQLTLLVMFAVSVPSLYLMAATDPDANFTAGNLVIFATYFILMLWLLLQGVLRFSRFLQVRADLATFTPVEE